MDGNQRVATENINEVILRLLKLNTGEEIDYQTYFQRIKTKLSSARLVGKGLPAEEDKLLREELKRVRNKKGRFKVKERKVRVSYDTSTSTGPKRPPRPSGSGGGNGPRNNNGKIVKSPKGKITADKFFYQNYVDPVKVKDITEKTTKVSKPKDGILDKISIKLDSIIETLGKIYDAEKNQIQKDRLESEKGRRSAREKELESKTFEGIKKALDTITKPFQSIWDRIVNFITNILLGRLVLKLIDWIADPKNQDKINTVIRFFGDHWPKLLALYLRFGTGLGKFVGQLTGLLVKGTLLIIKKTAGLAASLGLKGAGKVASFLGGPKGRLLGAGLTIGANVAGLMATSGFIEDFAGGGDKTNPEDLKEPSVPAYNGGGFFGGIKNFFGNMFSGLVNGPKGRDKVPAMLTAGEFVMSAPAVRKYGIDTLEGMNAAAGGTNIPEIVNGVTHAFGGGFVGDDDLRRMAANHNRGMNLKEIAFDPNNIEHSKTFERLKNVAVKRGVYKPPTSAQSYAKPNVNVNVNANTSPGSSIVRSQPGGLSTNVRPSMQSIRTNMRVPGGFGGLRSAGIEMLANYLMDRGFDKVNAMIIANKIDEGKKLTGDKKENYIERLRNVVDREERWQRGFGGIFDSIIGMGKESSSQKLSKSARAILEGMGSGMQQGGAIKGGFGLKDQSLKDAPKTMVMTDDKGRPFVGHKAIKNGKLTYVRGPQPGTGTTNPLEMLGRMINPGAYKKNDARLGMQNQKIAMANALERFQKQDMASDAQARMMKQMGGNLKDVQNDLDYRKQTTAAKIKPGQRTRSSVKPLPRQSQNSRYIPAGGAMGGTRGNAGGGGSRPSSGSKPPSFSPTHSSRATRIARSTLGINSKI